MTRLLNFLELKRGEESGILYALESRRGGVYIVVVEEIWMESRLMRVEEYEWKAV